MQSERRTSHDYFDAVAGLEPFGVRLTDLIRQILSNNGIPVHTVNFRVKSEESVRQKLNAKPGHYSGPSSLMDLLGLRVTCYFADEVDRVAFIIDDEFAIDWDNSGDKRENLGSKEFGYRSVHRIARLDPTRAALTEYSDQTNTTFELQIRSVLQHAWAEIEHDLGYKQSTIPEQYSRRFSRLAGVLELVDDEFASLRDELRAYERDLNLAAKNQPDNVDLNPATLRAALSEDPLLVELDEKVAAALSSPLASDISKYYVSWRLKELAEELGINDMTELRKQLAARRERVVRFASAWNNRPAEMRVEEDESGQPDLEEVSRGIGLFYFYLTLKAEQQLESGDAYCALDDGEHLGTVWEKVDEDFRCAQS
ncbi:hypothetical protein F7P69_17085 [Cellulosimicrobium funkei]|nr:hypothetical protein [Cellulosimicrobium funkei]